MKDRYDENGNDKPSELVKRPAQTTDRETAEAAGFTVDTHVYPWFAYKGPRFAPTAQKSIRTDLESNLAADLFRAVKTVSRQSETITRNAEIERDLRQRLHRAENRISDLSWTPGTYQNGL